ncbi:hypothetical protein CR513_37281, partial [Mucuna pruriens]
MRGNSKASTSEGCVTSTSDDGVILYSEATISSKGGKQLHDGWITDSCATWHMTLHRDCFCAYKPISEGAMSTTCEGLEEEFIVVKGNPIVIKVEKIIANLYMLLGETLQVANALVVTSSQEEATMI